MASKIEQSGSKAYLGPEGYETSISGTGDDVLHAYFWPAERKGQPKAVVFLLHGINTYIEFDFLKFQAAGKRNLYDGSWVHELNSQDFAVCGFDFKGFGRSGGTRGYINSLDEHVDDFISFVRHVRQKDDERFPEGVPYFVLAYDLGGLVGTLGSLRQPGWLAGLVLMSPMLKLEQRISEIKEQGSLKFYNFWMPRKALQLSEYDQPVRWLVDAWKADKLVFDCTKVRARTAVELIRATQQLAAANGPISLCCVSVPYLVLQGARDTALEPGGPNDLMQRAATHDKRLWTLPHRWHVVQKENGNEELLSDIIDWLDDRCRTSRTKGLFRKAAAAAADSKAAAPAAAPSGKSLTLGILPDGHTSDKGRASPLTAAPATPGTTGQQGKAVGGNAAGGPPGTVNASVAERAPAGTPAPVLLPTTPSGRMLQPMTSGRSTAASVDSPRPTTVSFRTRPEVDALAGSQPDEDLVARMARIALAAAEAEAELYGKFTKSSSSRPSLSPLPSVNVRAVVSGGDEAEAEGGPVRREAASGEGDGRGQGGEEEEDLLPGLPPGTPAGAGRPIGRVTMSPAAASTATMAGSSSPPSREASRQGDRPGSGGSKGGPGEDDAGMPYSTAALQRGPSGVLSPRAPLSRRWGSLKAAPDEAAEPSPPDAPSPTATTARPPCSLPPLGPGRFTPLPPIAYGGAR